MSLSAASTVLALAISVISLATSAVVSARQLRLANNSNVLPVVVELFRETRQPDRLVSLFYDDVGKLVAHGVVDERLIIGSYGPNIVNMWEVLAPYFYRERELTTKTSFQLA